MWILADVTIPEMLQPYLEVLLTALTALFVALLTWLAKKISDKANLKEAEKEGLLALTEGIVEIQRTYVDAVKVASADGKLTAAEMQQAKDAAIDQALIVAKGSGKDFLVALSRERLGALVEMILAKLKIGGFGEAPAPTPGDDA